MRLSPFSRLRDDSHDDGADALDRDPLMALVEPDLRQRVRERMTRRTYLAGKPARGLAALPDRSS